MRRPLLLLGLALCGHGAGADEVSLRLGGREIQLAADVRERLAVLAREALRSCGPNTSQHPGNFGLAALGVSEAVIGLEDKELFVGPDFTRHGRAVAEHLQCGYLASLELACLAELQAHLPARYRETCARLERDPQGRIVMPPPDIAPSCS